MKWHRLIFFFFSFVDSIVPVTICLLIERGLAEEVVKETAGMCAHVVNIIVLVLLPMVIIHINGDAFNLSKFVYISLSLEMTLKPKHEK